MKYQIFSEILNKNIFEKAKSDLLEKIVQQPY